ncbi:MAG: flagellar motor switch protein FliN [Proteobacteria bacterium]|nr:flagellar motor switch protein FliN [Pseudomonadota bacterium]MBU1059933.1 flagellar motor switch protein FliN [Pseudomonadota bacterium]
MKTDNIQKNAKPDPDEIKELLNSDETDTPDPSEYQKKSSGPFSSQGQRGLEFLYDVPLQISVEVGRSKILLKDLLKMGEGYVIELDKLAGEPLDLFVNSKLIAKGEAVMVGDKFGIRLTEVVSPSDRIEQLG